MPCDLFWENLTAASQRRAEAWSQGQGPCLSSEEGAADPSEEAPSSVKGGVSTQQGLLPPVPGAQAPALTCSFN